MPDFGFGVAGEAEEAGDFSKSPDGDLAIPASAIGPAAGAKPQQSMVKESEPT